MERTFYRIYTLILFVVRLMAHRASNGDIHWAYENSGEPRRKVSVSHGDVDISRIYERVR
jgi:hypothetical protein